MLSNGSFTKFFCMSFAVLGLYVLRMAVEVETAKPQNIVIKAEVVMQTKKKLDPLLPEEV